MQKYQETARKILQENIYCTIATSSVEGKPWISPVFFAFDDNYSIYWVSSKLSLHSTLIEKNPQVAIVIFNSQAKEGKGDGVYMEATAEELSKTGEVEQGMELLNQRITQDTFRIKQLGDVMGEGLWRIYKATPGKISKLGEGEVINGQYIDKRVEIK